tara:strand:- start:493 stop:666 length:174 start_codon:yes stop_codon:yes gene_type:complete
MLTKKYNYSIIKYNYINNNYNLTNYEIYDKMCKENKDVSWAYNIYFIEKYWDDKQCM